MGTRAFTKFWNGLAAHRAMLWVAGVSAMALFLALFLSTGGGGIFRSQALAAGDSGGGVASNFSEPQKREIEAVVRAYLLKNPKFLLEIEKELKKLVAEEEAVAMKKSIAKNAEFLFRRVNAPMAGNPNGDIPIVEFFDFNCGYCKRSFRDINALIAKDPKVKVLFMDYPILSKGSLEASKVALAARNQGKYWEVHKALLSHRGGGVDGKIALKIAKSQGLDMARLTKDMESPEIKAEIEKVQALAQSMDINGTPHFIVGDRNIPGAPSNLLNQILKNVSELRSEGCSVC